jgi:transposase
MLGPAKPRRVDQPIAVSLEDLVPTDNFYRHLETKLDLGFVREWVHDLHADRGRPSIDPVVFFKLQLVMFFEDISSECQLIATASLNLAHRWYLGYALDEDLPDHSSLTHIRQRLSVDLFQRFPLRRYAVTRTEGVVAYRAPATTCNACPVKTQCTESDHGRIVHRSFYANYLERVRAYHATEAYQKAMRKRQVWVEPLFAEAKAWHGVRRLRLRGLLNANIQGLLIAAGQHLKCFLARAGGAGVTPPAGASWSFRSNPGASRSCMEDDRSGRRLGHR